MQIDIHLPSPSLHHETGNKTSETRQFAFFDEILVGYVTGNAITDDVPEHCILTLYAYIVSDEKDEELIAEMNLQRTNEQVELGNPNTITWNFELPITYPRKRIEQPQLVLKCIYQKRLVDKNTNSSNSSEIIAKNYEPISQEHLVESLHDQELGESQNDSQGSFNLEVVEKSETKITIPIYTPLALNMKSTKPAGRNDILLSAISIESSNKSDELIDSVQSSTRDDNNDKNKSRENSLCFEILGLDASFDAGVVSRMGQKVPSFLNITDLLRVVYKFSLNDVSSSNQLALQKPVVILLKYRLARVGDENKLEPISNIIETLWTPYLDFSLVAPPISNGLRTSNTTHPLDSSPNLLGLNSQRQKSQLLHLVYRTKGFSNSLLNTNIHNNGITAPDQLARRTKLSYTRNSSMTVSLTGNGNLPFSGLKLIFLGKLYCKVGKTLKWQIQAINHSKFRLNLSLSMDSTKSASSFSSSSPSYISSLLTFSRNIQQRGPDRADEDSGVLLLSNDVRIGPMDPQSIYETEMSFICSRKGVFNLDGLKITDSITGDGLNFGKLIEIFIV